MNAEQRRRRFAHLFLRFREQWHRYARNAILRQVRAERTMIRKAFSDMGTVEGARSAIEHYYKHEAKPGWQKTLRTIWEESGKATIEFMDAYHNAKFSPSGYYVMQVSPLPYEIKQLDEIQNNWLQFVDGYLRDRAPGDVRITGINDTTKDKIMDVIADGMREGNGMPEIGKQVEDHLDVTWPSRGETIARTETVGATNYASLEEARSIAPQLLKSWTCTFSKDSRQAHMDADEEYGANPIPQNQPFIVDGEELDVPGDPSGSADNIINCECCVTYEEPEAEAPAPEEAPTSEEADTIRGFIEERDNSTRPEFLSPLTPEDLKDHKVILMNDGKTGYAISPDGELENLFNNSGIKDAGKAAVKEAIKNGANKLNCYDGFLPEYYKQFGFKEIERVVWNNLYAPKNWDYDKLDRPDVIFMELVA